MITYKEALQKAKMLKPNTDHCTEYENGFVFGSKEKVISYGGPGTPLVVLKKNGNVMTMGEFVISGTGKEIKRIDI